jgi:hypothetical protein
VTMPDRTDNSRGNVAPAEASRALYETATPIAAVRSYDDLRRVVADWCETIHMTRAELDVEAGLADGHAGKLLANRAQRKLSMVSLGRIMAAAGLVLIVARDHEAPQRAGNASTHASTTRQNHWRRNRGTAWGRRMAARRALKLTADQRSEIARHAANTRHQRRHAAPAGPNTDAAE